MEKYNYYREVANDIFNWMDVSGDPFPLTQFNNREEAAEWLYDELWSESEITGNGPDSFYADEEFCEECLCHNTDLIIDSCDEFCVDYTTLRQQYKKGQLARYLDCTIRCYVFMTAIYDALEEYEKCGFKYKEDNKC